MPNYINIFCENCGAPINADTAQQYVKCNNCNTVVSNPKYLKQEEFTATTTTNVTHEKKSGGFFGFFRNLGRAFSSNNHRVPSHNHFDDHHHHHHHDPFDNRNNPFDNYYAVIKKNAFSYSGECPGISFTSVMMCDSYDECITQIEKKLGDKIGSFNKKYDQPDPSTLNLDSDERIVRVVPRR